MAQIVKVTSHVAWQVVAGVCEASQTYEHVAALASSVRAARVRRRSAAEARISEWAPAAFVGSSDASF